MKKKVLYAVLPLVLLAGCQREASIKQSTHAAKEIYLQYADREDLTVALIGGYRQGSDTYNAVMFQAETDEAWAWIKGEFGVDVQMPVEGFPAEAGKLMTIGYNMDPSVYGDETMIASIIDSIIQPVLPSGDTAHVVQKKVLVMGEQEGVPPQMGTLVGMNGRLLQMAQVEGKSGYVVCVDEVPQMLWLFFYSTLDEYRTLMEHLPCSVGAGNAGACDMQQDSIIPIQ